MVVHQDSSGSGSADGWPEHVSRRQSAAVDAALTHALRRLQPIASVDAEQPHLLMRQVTQACTRPVVHILMTSQQGCRLPTLTSATAELERGEDTRSTG